MEMRRAGQQGLRDARFTLGRWWVGGLGGVGGLNTTMSSLEF